MSPVPPLAQPPVDVALVVPLRNEEASLPPLLDSIQQQTLRPAQIVLVDGGSSDSTVELARSCAAVDDRFAVVHGQGDATPGRGRNLGAAASTAQWLAFTDAGIRLEPDWLEQLWRVHLEEPDAHLVYGNYEFDVTSEFEWAAALAYGVAKVETPRGRCRGPSVVSCLVSRTAFDAVGGFIDSRAGEDERFSRAVEAAGFEIVWAPAATVHWRLRPTFATTFTRFRTYSYHYVLAGEQAHWHYRMARNYVPVGVALALSAVHDRRWLALAAVVTGGRVLARVRRHAPETGWAAPVRPDRLARITAVTLAADVATAVGWWQARRSRR